MSATSGGGGSVSEGSEAGGSSQSTMSVSDSPSTSFQANLAADNVTKITLSEENSAGGFAADMTGSKVNLTLDDRQQDGIVNVAFDYEEGGNRVSSGGGAGDGFKSMNGSEKKDKVPEAVNLELVNMVPYSNGNGTSYGVPVNGIPGIPMKKDSEQVDMGTPYDEYFVPVNEHKKYMRGEKLYVTKDKRRPTSWRRCLSWVVACTVISVVLIVAILAGTGVILSQEPNLVKDASVGRNFAGSNLKPSVTEKSLTPTAEKLMYVPRSIESEFVIDNLDFDPALRDLNSSAYQQFTSTMEDQLKMFLFDKETLESGASDVGIKVVNISHDPFKVNYRIGWNYKQGVNNPPEPIKMEDVKRRLVESLARNQGYIDKYHIDREAIKVDHVINACQMENGGCSHICYYNYITQQFTCTCPTHLVLDSTGKNCVAWAGSSEDDAVPIPSHGAYPGMPYESTADPVQDYEYSEGFQTGVHQGVRHHAHDSADSDYKIPNDQQHGDHEPTAEPSPEPTGEPASNQQDKSSADFDVKSESVSKLDGKDTYNKEHDHGTSVTSGVNTQYEHGQSDIHSYQEATGPQANPEPTAEPAPEDKYHDYAVHSVYGSEKSEPEPSPEPGLESTASKDHDHMAHSSYESKNHEPAAEPTPEPASEPTAEPSFEGKNYGHSIHESKDHEPAAEPSPGRDDHDHIVLSVHEMKDHEPSAEPTPEPAPEPTAEINTEGKDHAVHSLYDSKDHEPSAEPTPEPAPEPNTEDKNHAMHTLSESEGHEPAAEPTPEPGPEPVTESNTDGKDQEGHSSYKSGDHEPTPEPTSAEPTPESVAESTVKTNTDDNSHAMHTLYEPKDKVIVETAAEVNPQNQDKEHGTHFVPVNEEKMEYSTERATLEDSEKARNTHFTYAFSDKESEGHSTVDFTPEEKNKEQGSHSMYNTTGATSEAVGEPNQHLVHGHNSADHEDGQTKEHSQKVSSESIYNEHQTQMTTTRGSDHVESTSHSQSPEGDRNLKPGFSIRESSQELTPQEGQMQMTEFKTEYPNEAHSSNSRPQEENKSGHHTVPYLEDVLIKKPDSDFSENNGTYLEQNVERTASGEPVIEEVIIEKPGTKEYNNTETSPTVTSGFQTHLHNESGRSNSTPTEALSDVKAAINGFQSGNSTDGSSFLYKQFSETSANSGIKIAPSMNTESSTNGPRNFEHSTTLSSGSDSKETGVVENSHNPENPKSNSESTTTTDDQHSTGSFKAEINSFGFNSMPPNSENETNLENKSIHSSQSNMTDVTTQPTIQNEYHTIPVAVEFSGSAENSQNNDENSKREKHGDEPESNTRLEEPQTTLSHGEESAGVTKYPKTDTVFSSGESDQTKAHEMTTESHVSVTTILSVLPPNTAEQKMNSQTKENEPKLKENTHDNKAVNEHSQPETNETTKLPEEFSNNIKDELLDNEEFNTLIDKEYKNREDSSTDGKEVLNKYPSKAQKIDKKKVKDYVKGEKVDSEKKAEVTVRPGVTPEDYILQKHVNGNENTFDLEYSLQNEHTTKHDGEVTVIDPHGLDGVPGVSFKPHGINNHDIKVLQTIAPDFRAENVQNHDLELQKPDSKIRLLDGKEGEPKQDKDYPKFDKDYKYEKQKVSKKKDLKKKGGSGKDGKNVELDEGRKYFTEFSKEDVETNPEVFKDFSETTMNPSLEKITTIPETGVKIMSGSATETTTLPEYKVKIDSTPQLSYTNTFEKKTERTGGITQPSGQPQSMSEETSTTITPVSTEQLPKSDQRSTSVDQNYHQIIDEPSVKTTSNVSPGTVYDGQPPESTNSRDSGTTHAIINTSGLKPNTESGNGNTGNGNATPGTVFDGVSNDATIHGSVSSPGFESSGSTIGEPGPINSFAVPTLVTNEGTTVESGIYKNTTANPTIIIHGQSGSLQDGHTTRFGNLTFYTSGNATHISALNGTLNNSDSHVFTFANHTTFPNGSVVQPTIIVRGQSGTLQDGHEIKFGNATFVTSLPNEHLVFKNSEVYKIKNGSLPGSVFDGHINSQDNQYHTFSNATGTFVYSNTTDKQPAFIIKGESGDFGNARAYIMSNDSGSAFSRDFTAPSVIFRNSTVFAVGNTPVGDSSTGNIHEITAAPQDVTSNDTIHYTRQVSPKFFSTGTAYKVNNYFGYISKCAAGQFQCVNGTSKRGSACISLSSKCDSINDCSDGSDELGCIENGCPGNFQCSDGSCLKRNLVCNGILDCSDGSDEKQCESWKCEFDEFQCPSGRCIPVVWQCDGKPDCDNHTDEYNCQTSCGNDEYLCPEGWCVPLTYRCNGVKECSNGEDEQLCDCPHEEFKCQTGGCVSMKQVCDGLDDCPDRSDEWDCVKLEPGTNLLKIRTEAGNYEPVCADDWTSQYSDEVCTSLGYYSSVPVDNENKSSIMTETSFFVLKNGSTGNLNKKIIVNLEKSERNCTSGKMVEIACQEFTCGSRSMTDSSSVEARLVGGMGATAGQWPSVALVYNIRNFHSCTANVLTPRWVLASYNCLKMGNKNLNVQDWKFFGGSTVFEAERENAETRKIVSIIPHPQVKFNQFLFSNDLALVELEQSLQFSTNLGAVCLPEEEMQPRQICVTAGWGMNSPEDKSIRQQLQYLPVPTMNLTECNSTEHYSGFITDDKICAGYNSAQKSLCYNEEGAPLMCVNDKGEWELQGVLSYHSNCGRGSHPSIFSSITPVKDWIKKTIGNAFERKAVTVTKR